MTSLPGVLFLCLTLGFISTQTSICQTGTSGGESHCFDPIDKLQEIKERVTLNLPETHQYILLSLRMIWN